MNCLRAVTTRSAVLRCEIEFLLRVLRKLTVQHKVSQCRRCIPCNFIYTRNASFGNSPCLMRRLKHGFANVCTKPRQWNKSTNAKIQTTGTNLLLFSLLADSAGQLGPNTQLASPCEARETAVVQRVRTSPRQTKLKVYRCSFTFCSDNLTRSWFLSTSNKLIAEFVLQEITRLSQ